jgi:hypothetical protein
MSIPERCLRWSSTRRNWQLERVYETGGNSNQHGGIHRLLVRKSIEQISDTLRRCELLGAIPFKQRIESYAVGTSWVTRMSGKELPCEARCSLFDSGTILDHIAQDTLRALINQHSMLGLQSPADVELLHLNPELWYRQNRFDRLLRAPLQTDYGESVRAVAVSSWYPSAHR